MKDQNVDNIKIYIGTTEGEWKKCWYNPQLSFSKKTYRNGTFLSCFKGKKYQISGYKIVNCKESTKLWEWSKARCKLNLDGSVSLFNDIPTFVGYLMPKPYL